MTSRHFAIGLVCGIALCFLAAAANKPIPHLKMKTLHLTPTGTDDENAAPAGWHIGGGQREGFFQRLADSDGKDSDGETFFVDDKHPIAGFCSDFTSMQVGNRSGGVLPVYFDIVPSGPEVGVTFHNAKLRAAFNHDAGNTRFNINVLYYATP